MCFLHKQRFCHSPLLVRPGTRRILRPNTQCGHSAVSSLAEYQNPRESSGKVTCGQAPPGPGLRIPEVCPRHQCGVKTLPGDIKVHPGLKPTGDTSVPSKMGAPWRWTRAPVPPPHPLCRTNGTLHKRLLIWTDHVSLSGNFHFYTRPGTSGMEDGAAICDRIFPTVHCDTGVTAAGGAVKEGAEPPSPHCPSS